jgi:triacylglycerol esterase/lipase EstA (alpha/beta hydrolase family)
MASTLGSEGVPFEVIGIDDGTGDLNVYAQRVVTRAQQLVAGGAPSVDIIGFSAGGVIARIAGTDPVGRPLIRRIATIASPHAGTTVAALGALFGQCPPACEQLDPDSALLESLPQASAPDRYLTVWSRSDDVIRPPESSELENATSVVVQDLCDRIVGHNATMSDPVTLTAVPAFLAGSPLPSTCPG